MNFASDLTHTETGPEMAQAHSLRRYLFRRASQLKTLEYSANGQEVEKSYALAKGLPFRRVRQDGQGWCEWLGLDTSVQDDPHLQAFFVLCAPDRDDPEANYRWQRLLKECQANRVKALRKWRNLGAEAMHRAATQRVAPMSDTELAKAKLKSIYLRKPNGKKPLKAPAKSSPQRGRVREA
jgi:hypothetical protein